MGLARVLCFAAVAVGLAVTAAPATADKILVTSIVGPPKLVPVGEFRTATAKCPRGYQATGSGLLLGAIEPVSDFRASGRLWKSDGFNPSDNFGPFEHRIQVVCMTGTKGIDVDGVSASRVSAAGSDGGDRKLIEQARRDYAKGVVR